MTTRAALKLDNRNIGGIAKESLNGVNFRVLYMQNGEMIEGIHNDANESIPALRRRLGLAPDELLAERLR